MVSPTAIPQKVPWGDEGGPSSIAEGVSELEVDGGGKSASLGEVGGFVDS